MPKSSASKKSAKRAKAPVRKSSVKKQSMRDVIVAPTLKQIERSIKHGKMVSAGEFRASIGW